MNDSEQCDFTEFDRPLSRHSGKQGGHLIKVSDEGTQDEFQIEQVKCQVCFEIIGKCVMENFDIPMKGSMFISKDTKHGYPPPFPRDFEWKDLRCPVCLKRPFFDEHYFLNEKNERCGHGVQCELCGKFFKNKLGLYGHTARVHKEQEDGDSDVT